MSARHRSGIKKYAAAILFLVLILGLSVSASAATWKLNPDGTYSCYENGKLVKNKWVKEGNIQYYVNEKGVRQTGWLQKSGKWYYFTRTGQLLKNTWIKSGGKTYCAGPDGALYTNGMHKIGSYYYAFSVRGIRQTGRKAYNGTCYFFESKAGASQGRMVTKQWRTWKGNQHYFGVSGKMLKNQWIGRYYVNGGGICLKNQWRGKKYLGSTGYAVSGLQNINGTYYYFNTKTYEKVTNTTMTIGGVTYIFDSTGKGKIKEDENGAPPTSVNVERTYYSDPYVDDETLLAAILYCESGNQPYTGQLAVGLVIMNRVYDVRFPSKLREIIYQKSQFSPTFDGALTRALKNPSLVTENCKRAAADVMNRMKTHKAGQDVYLEIEGKETLFPHLFFMTPAAYRRLGLTAKYVQIGGHVFFTNWA